jgi:repressor LexA
MARASISPRQKEIIRFIHRFNENHGYPPTVREIGEGVHLSSSSTVHAHLKSLENRGIIQRDAVLTRAIRLVAEVAERFMPQLTSSNGKPSVLNLPIIGTVAAGKPILAVEDVEDYFPLPANFVTGESYMLKIRGNSMIEDGIHDGDFVVVRRQQTAENGDTVVAMMDGEATVKRYYLDTKRIRLQPANKDMAPIFVDHADILGKVVGLVRKFA